MRGWVGVVGFALLVTTGCASLGKTLEISGVSIEALGNNFLTVNEAFTTGCPAGTIKAADCDTYRVLGKKFQQMYPVAAQLWFVAKDTNDVVSEKAAEAAIAQLAVDLAVMAAMAHVTLSGGN